MFKRIELENYRSFDRISLDLTGPLDAPLKHAFVYGENGSGKTNMMSSIRFLKDSIDTLSIISIMSSISGRGEDAIRDAARTRNLRVLAGSNRLIGCAEPMRTFYHFTVNGSDTTYEMVFDKGGRLIREELRQRSGKRMGRLFLVEAGDDGPAMSFARGLFLSRSMTRRATKTASRIWGSHSMMSIVKELYLENDEETMSLSMDPSVKAVLDSIDSVSASIPSMDSFHGQSGLIGGQCVPGHVKTMEGYAKGLSSFLSRSCSDICDAYYIFTEAGEGLVRYDLIIARRVAGAVREIPAVSESTGVRTLIRLFRPLVACAEGGVAFIDEMDAGVHEKMLRDILEEVLPDLDGQLIATTHNASLLEMLNPRNAFFLRSDAEGSVEASSLHSICKTQKNHNNRQRYLAGQFDAVPAVGKIDIRGICEGLREDPETDRNDLFEKW